MTADPYLGVPYVPLSDAADITKASKSIIDPLAAVIAAQRRTGTTYRAINEAVVYVPNTLTPYKLVGVSFTLPQPGIVDVDAKTVAWPGGNAAGNCYLVVDGVHYSGADGNPDTKDTWASNNTTYPTPSIVCWRLQLAAGPHEIQLAAVVHTGGVASNFNMSHIWVRA